MLKLVGIFNKGKDATTLLDVFERQRRKTTHDFIQAQTIKNMEYLSRGEGMEHEQRKAEMQHIHDDPIKRRSFLLRQSMIESLEQEKELV